MLPACHAPAARACTRAAAAQLSPPHTPPPLQLQTAEADVKRLIAERRTLLAKLADVEVVEGSVRELYVQMKVCARVRVEMKACPCR